MAFAAHDVVAVRERLAGQKGDVRPPPIGRQPRAAASAGHLICGRRRGRGRGESDQIRANASAQSTGASVSA